MAKALLDFTALSSFRPLRGLFRWLRGVPAARSEASAPAWSRWPHRPACTVHGAADEPMRQRAHRDENIEGEGPAAACSIAAGQPASHFGGIFTSTAPVLALPAPAERGARHAAALGRGCTARVPGPVRVVQRRHAGTPERFVISGRMADVRAELERWAAAEAVLN